MEFSQELSMLKILVVVLHEHFSCLFVKGTFWKRHNEQAFNDLEDVIEGPCLGVPVFF